MDSAPGIQRPNLDGVDPKLATILRNVYDNLFYLRQPSASSASSRITGVTSRALFIVGTHTSRITKFAPQGQNPGTAYFESDRHAIYTVTDGPPRAWIWIGGIMFGLDAAKPTDLGADDKGFLYYATDVTTLKIWNGTAYASV